LLLLWLLLRWLLLRWLLLWLLRWLLLRCLLLLLWLLLLLVVLLRWLLLLLRLQCRLWRACCSLHAARTPVEDHGAYTDCRHGVAHCAVAGFLSLRTAAGCLSRGSLEPPRGLYARHPCGQSAVCAPAPAPDVLRHTARPGREREHNGPFQR